jgi:GMP synthase (glutamine-hydrolysing)
MRFVVLRHQDEEGLGTIADWLTSRGHGFFYVNLYAGQKPPTNALTAYDGLVAMGGPMSVNDDSRLVKTSLALIHDFTYANRPVIGVCLGAQGIAKIAGGTVSPSAFELGFGEVQPETSHPFFSDGIPDNVAWKVFQWHGENFSLPAGALPLFTGDLVHNQGFTFKNALAVQFHCELSLPWYTMWYESLRHKFPGMDKLMPPNSNMPFAELEINLFALLDRWQRDWQR